VVLVRHGEAEIHEEEHHGESLHPDRGSPSDKFLDGLVSQTDDQEYQGIDKQADMVDDKDVLAEMDEEGDEGPDEDGRHEITQHPVFLILLVLVQPYGRNKGQETDPDQDKPVKNLHDALSQPFQSVGARPAKDDSFFVFC